MYSLRLRLREPYHAQALLFDLGEGSLVDEILEAAFKEQTGALESAAVVFFRFPVWRQFDPKRRFDPTALHALGFSNRSNETIFDRYKNRPVYIIGSRNYKYWVVGNINPTCKVDEFSFRPGDARRLLKLIRHTEMDFLADEGRAVMPEIEGSYYRPPSGSHQTAFIRVGNIQYSQLSLDILFFWLLPILRRCSGVITETWSIASTALNISRRLAVYEGRTNPCFVEMLPQYYGLSDYSMTKYETAELFERLISSAKIEVGVGQRLLFLMSAVNTGGLHREVRQRIGDKLGQKRNIVFATLFNLGKRRSEIFCLRDLSDEAQVQRGVAKKGRFSPVDTLPKEGDSFIDIDAKTYFPSRYRDVTHQLRQPDANMPKDNGYLSFIKRYPLDDLIRVHKNVVGDTTQRHHSIWIDTSIPIRSRSFQARLESILKRLEPKPRLIITPLHAAATALAGFATQVFAEIGCKITHIRHPNLFVADQIALENVGVLESINALDPVTESLLILDDAFISGRRLARYQSHLRATSFEGVVHYIVGIVRCDDPATWDNQAEMLKYRPRRWPLKGLRNTVESVEKIIIPNWDTSECPWCAELRYYNRISGIRGIDALPSGMIARRDRLRRATQVGLTDGLFLSPPGSISLTLRDNSVFQTEVRTEAAFYGAIASAMQFHRSSKFTECAPLGRRRYPIATVLDHEEYLTTKIYTDAFIRACFLRAARSYEVVYTDEESEKKKTAELEHLITSMIPTDSEIGPEAVLAKALGKLPKLNTQSGGVEALLKLMQAVDLFRELSPDEQEALERAETSPLPAFDDS